MVKAKAGLLGLDDHDRQISNKGSIADIRRHTDEAIPYGGIPHLAILGAGNAIGGTNAPPSTSVRLDPASIDKIANTEAKFIKQVEDKILGEGGFAEAGRGGTQSAESKRAIEKRIANEEAHTEQQAADERRKIKPPAEVPPFVLKQGTSPEFEAWVKYLQAKIPPGEDRTQLISAVKTDSLDFMTFRGRMIQLKKQLREWNDDWRSHLVYLNNFLIDVGSLVVDEASKMIKDAAKKAITPKTPEKGPEYGPQTKKESDAEKILDMKKELAKVMPVDSAVDKMINYVKNILPKKSVPFPDQVHAFYDMTTAVHPHWKVRLDKDREIALKEWGKKFEEALSGGQPNPLGF